MSTAARQPRRNAILNVRVSDATKRMIENAATATGKTTSEFVLDAARGRAADVLLDQTLFTLPAADFDAFVAALDHPPAPNAALTALMAEPRRPTRA